ncbi:hypothetical protein [Plantactinospora sp. B5E13]|uniref:hypothetical protein n=1 Tax=Plantactinospora sp. B5E13 TaxID=3153758 RepID=UPI00325C4071
MRRIHQPDWRRLWRYCRCGAPWGCLGTVPPDSAVLAALDQLLADARTRTRPPNPGRFRQPADPARGIER